MNVAHQLIDRAHVSGNEPAVTDVRGGITFATLVDRVTRIAGSLRGPLGLDQGDRVLVLLGNRREFLEVVASCWIAGLCPVPVNAKLHGREVAYIGDDCGATALFVDEALLEGLEEHSCLATESPRRIVAGSAGYEALTDGRAMQCATADSADPAWIFYTSGTTGTPKGATLTHSNLAAMVRAYYADIERVAPGQTMLHAAPLSHGAGLYALPHMFGGGHQVVLSGFDVWQVLDAFALYPEVSLFMAPTMLNRLVKAAEQRPDAVGRPRSIIYGGAPMYVRDLQRALEALGPCLYQLYGQGESPMTITGLSKRDHQGAGDASHLARLASCGVARAGVDVQVVDESGQPVAEGESGEVVTRSACVMRGYWENPVGTAEAVQNGWLRTGDIGWIDGSGYLTLHDRSKDMIISGGHNIYPREIEEVLLHHERVLECSVVGRSDPEWGEVPVAFVVSDQGAPVTAQELDALCLGQIARFKRPRDYRFVEALPKNNYGKVLKTELRARLGTQGGSSSSL